MQHTGTSTHAHCPGAGAVLGGPHIELTLVRPSIWKVPPKRGSENKKSGADPKTGRTARRADTDTHLLDQLANVCKGDTHERQTGHGASAQSVALGDNGKTAYTTKGKEATLN